MKSIPLSVAMGGDARCCVHGDTCKKILKSSKGVVSALKNASIHFRCPILVEVDDDVDYAEWYESCFENKEEAD